MLKHVKDFFESMVSVDPKSPMYPYRNLPEEIQKEIKEAMEAKNITDIR